MKNEWMKKALPHAVAILIFLIVSVVFCKPVMDGKVLSQHDIIGWKGSAQNAFDVKEKTGQFPLWNTNVFSGMPNYQIAMEGKSVLPDFNKLISLGLPKPMNYFFTAALCFYILCIVLGLNPLLGILGGLAFAFSTYNPIIIGAGHETKMMAISYMPLLVAGILLIFKKRYWIGLAITALAATFEFMSNHPQINYYLSVVLAALAVAYTVKWVKENDYKQIIIAGALACIGAAVGLGNYYLAYSTTKEYANYTMRGGKTVEIKGTEVVAATTKGLDADYAFLYSMSKAEPLVMLMPNAYGGSSMNTLKEGSKVVEKLTDKGIPEMSAIQLASSLPAYWGGMSGPGESTSGPPYIGALIFILAIIGFVIVKGPMKWALLAATILSVFMSWGKYFEGFNIFLFNTLPLYNKFRAPSMSLVISQLTMPLMAVLTLYALFFKKESQAFVKANFKVILYTVGGLTLLLVLLYIAQDYSSPFDTQILNAKFDESGSDTVNRAIITGLKADRQSMFGMQVLRSIAFMVLVIGAIYLYIKNYVKPIYLVSALLLILFIDLFSIGKKYLTDESYIDKSELQAATFSKTPIDEQILQDKDAHYRVLDFTRGFTDNRASYFHRSVSGYHAAKLRIYQDIIERYFDGSPNEQIINALDTKYIITQTEQGQMQVVQNPNAYGAVWFVKAIKPVADDVQELQSIGHTHLKDTAVLQKSFVGNISPIVPDSSAKINLVKYTNDEIEYTSNANSPQFAVFSEVYYPAGWNAYIDGKKTEILKTNYFLRGLPVPAGQHTIKMVFEPETVKRGIQISYISSILLAIIFIGGLAMQWWVDKGKLKKSV